MQQISPWFIFLNKFELKQITTRRRSTRTQSTFLPVVGLFGLTNIFNQWECVCLLPNFLHKWSRRGPCTVRTPTEIKQSVSTKLFCVDFWLSGGFSGHPKSTMSHIGGQLTQYPSPSKKNMLNYVLILFWSGNADWQRQCKT